MTHVALFLQVRASPISPVRGIGWLRLVGSLKRKVFFAEYRLRYWALLQKRPIILRSLLIVATPYGYIYMAAMYTWPPRAHSEMRIIRTRTGKQPSLTGQGQT